MLSVLSVFLQKIVSPLSLVLLSVFVLNSCSSLARHSAPNPPSQPYPLSSEHAPNAQLAHVQLRGTVRLSRGWLDGVNITELSGLAWDEKSQTLYAVNDRGSLFHLKVQFDTTGQLTAAEVVKAMKLQDANGNLLSRWDRDSEGLVLNHHANNTELLVSFERQPRIVRYDVDGKYLGEVPLHPALHDISDYQSKNKALEALALHPDFGTISAPEYPLAEADKSLITLFGEKGQRWQLPRHPATDSAVTALEVMDDGSLLVLERAYVSPIHPLIISLRRVWLNAACAVGQTQSCPVQPVLEMSSHAGWSIDNFEGMTQHTPQHFFLVSDDNESHFQDMLLSYFALPRLANPLKTE